MTQRDEIKKLIIDFCNKKNERTFTLKELRGEYGDFQQTSIGSNTPYATVRKLVRELHAVDFVNAHGNSGRYTLNFAYLLESELADMGKIDISAKLPEKKEYLVESFARNSKWVQGAIEAFGRFCMMPDCDNTFIKPNNKRYIEVHHIIPLCSGGDNTLDNLSVLCAHHHRMAHFARDRDKEDIKNYLLHNIKRRLQR